jgi:hypothetical protein
MGGGMCVLVSRQRASYIDSVVQVLCARFRGIMLFNILAMASVIFK